jgi:replicative DNA helicase
MAGEGKAENRNLEVAHITGRLKQLAKELDCPMIALSQLNRSLEQRKDKRPTMSDLRDSGSIEQDADVIIFLYQDAKYNPDTIDQDRQLGYVCTEAIVAKQRNGETATLPFDFYGKFQRYEEHEHDYLPSWIASPKHQRKEKFTDAME